jgi:hypothetical protein
MRLVHNDIDKILPFGELIRGFANQSNISKGDLKKTLRGRGIFLSSSEKEEMVPCLITLLLSPAEFDELRECQNTREDTFKKSSSRIGWNSPLSLMESIPNIFPKDEIIHREYTNYQFKQPPTFTVIDNNKDKIRIDYEIERFDLNKSWYESHNVFGGNLIVEKINSDEIQIIRTYTSSETDDVGNRLQRFIVKQCKEKKFIEENKELDKILFSSFSNSSRIVFFWRLTTHMDNEMFDFEDLIDIQFRPDNAILLPQEINWMNKKDELILKGSELQNTFFIKEKEYHQYLQFWGLEGKFRFNYLGLKGNLTVSFEFANFSKFVEKAEFEIKIISINFAGQMDLRDKENKKQKLLEILENKKNDIYNNYMNYLAPNILNDSNV